MVTELLGADLMEHNILHSGIGIKGALDILQRYYDIDNLGRDTFLLFLASLHIL